MKMSKDDLIDKIANNLTDAADLDSLMDYFREGQIRFLEDMSENELKEYANELLGYDVDDEL